MPVHGSSRVSLVQVWMTEALVEGRASSRTLRRREQPGRSVAFDALTWTGLLGHWVTHETEALGAR